MRGLFVTFEGIDGCGKSTQIEILQNLLSKRGYKNIFVREPGGTQIGESIRTILLDKINTNMKPETELLLFEAARAQNVNDLILPALHRGETVICDRFADSSTAYQGYGRLLDVSAVKMLNAYATGGLTPDITFLFDIDPKIAASRLEDRTKCNDRIDLESIEFSARVRNGYLEIAKEEPSRIKIIDAAKDINSISKEIYKIYEEVIINEIGLRDSK